MLVSLRTLIQMTGHTGQTILKPNTGSAFDAQDEQKYIFLKNHRKVSVLEIHSNVQSYLLFKFKNELPRPSPAALSLKDALLVQQDPLQGLRRRGLLGAGLLGHLLHQDVVARVGVGQDAVGILGLGQSLGRTRTCVS